MGAVIKLGIGDLPDALDLGEQNIRRAVARGALAGAHRGRALMVRVTPVDQGQLKASWKVKPGLEEFDGAGETLAELINDAPHISMVELGSRPHKISPEAWAAIYEWVRRHYRGAAPGVETLGGAGRMRPRGKGPVTGAFKGDDPVISHITNAIAWKIRKEGTKATLFVRNAVDDLRDVMAAELQHELAKVARGTKPKATP